MRTRSVAVHLIVKNSATLSLSSFCLDWSLWKEPPIISGQNRVASLFILVNFWWHFLADSHIGKGHSLYTVQCQSEWIYGLSNVERGCLQDSWPQTGGQESWIWCSCSSCCGLLWSPRPLLLCPSEIVNSLAFSYDIFISLSPSPRVHQFALWNVLPWTEQKQQESDYFLEIGNQLCLSTTRVSQLHKWMRIREVFLPTFVDKHLRNFPFRIGGLASIAS